MNEFSFNIKINSKKGEKKMNKISKIIISALCIGSMLSTTTYAKEINTEGKSAVQQVPKEKLKKVELQNKEVKDLHQDKTLNEVRNDMKGEELSKEAKLENFKLRSDFKGAISGVSKSIKGTIPKEGGYTYVTASLGTNQILQATLKCPNNKDLDYDLYIYEFKDDGTLGNCVDSSTTTTYFNQYPDGTQNTLDEGVSYINKGTSVKRYAVIISSKKGASATDEFTLNLSLDIAGSYDAAEPNNNPYKAYTINQGTISGANLNVANDQDWYVWNVPADFNKANITVDKGYKVEVYTANGTSMVLRNPDANNEYSLSKGYYYVKVFNNSDNFTPSNYALNVNPTKLNPAKIIVDMNGDMGKDFPSYDGTKNHLRFKNTLYPTVTVSSENGYAVSGCPVYLNWQSESWIEESGNRTRVSETKYTQKDGTAVVPITVPTAIGVETYTNSGAKTFRHYFDIDTVRVVAGGSVTYTALVYHFAYSDYIGG
jgi:hypothetical protein